MKLNPDSIIARLGANFPAAGRLEWIGVRPEPRAPVVPLDCVEALTGRGLAGDHRSAKPSARRHVTLIQSEHLDVVAALLGHERIDPQLTRRNLVVSGINLVALKDQLFSIGDVVLQAIDSCEPCSRMEANLGCGGYNAMRGHGGITARVVVGGLLRVGESVIARADRIRLRDPAV